MTDRPLILSGLEVRAVIEGRKTQFRRVLKPQPNALNGGLPLNNGYGAYSTEDGWKKYPYALGDRLWVRETWRRAWPASSYSDGIVYIADAPKSLGMDEYSTRHKWNPSTQMPRTASRLTLVVTDVRVQRVQDISEDDAMAEGVTSRPRCNRFKSACTGWSMDWSRVGQHSKYAENGVLTEQDISLGSARHAFFNFFNVLCGGDRWNVSGKPPVCDENPWVVAVTFDKETTDV
jgi:hypothetical protein